ncbi:MAG: GIY-YIG nuclease family protein [Synechococcales cyanobacterium CRU_2_2]|nr:GIY-YIG nuclease family protein [Synechococcales cyanobacterium CRU_2_2]
MFDATGEVVYVGQSQNIHKRWNHGHHKLPALLALGDSATLRIKFVLLPIWLLNRAEHAAIAFHKPRLNQKMPPVV